MKVLAIETSSTTGGVALVVDGQISHREVSAQQRSHGELISIFSQNCLKAGKIELGDLDAIAVGRGPGSFTGLRVAASAAKSYAFATNKPLVAIDSLTLLAAPVALGQAANAFPHVLALLNAHKNLLYAALFKPGPDGRQECLRPAQVASVEEVEGWFQGDALVVGEGFSAYADAWSDDFLRRAQRMDQISNFPDPATLGLLAETEVQSGRVIDWKMYTPLYLRASEAEEKQRGLFLKPQAVRDEVHGKNRRS